MIEQRARITRCNGHTAQVLCRPVQCLACDRNQGCGAGLFTRLLPSAPRELDALNPNGLPADAEVIIGLPENAFLSSAFHLYGWPLLGLFAGMLAAAGLGSWYDTNADLAALGGAIAGIGLVLWARRARTRDVPLTILRSARQ